MWPHDVESVQGSTFCLFVMVQPWHIGVCWIDQVFVTELTVVIFFVHAAVLSIKTAFNLVNIHLIFRIIPLIQWSVMFCRPCFNPFWGLKYIPRLFSEYMLTFRVEEPMKICATNKIRNISYHYFSVSVTGGQFNLWQLSVVLCRFLSVQPISFRSAWKCVLQHEIQIMLSLCDSTTTDKLEH